MIFVSRLSDELIAQYCGSSLSFWGGSLTLEEYTKRNLRHVERSGGLMRFEGMVNESGELLASYKRYDLTGCVYSGAGEDLRSANKRTIKILGIGAVFTQETARRQGAASKMLQAAMEAAKREGFDAALLFSDIKPDFYERLGFVSYEAIDRSLFFGTTLSSSGELARAKRRTAGDPSGSSQMDSRLRGKDAAVTTRAFTPEDEALCYQYSLESRGSSGAQLTPTLEEWRFFRWRNAKNPCLILQQHGKDVGYVIVEAEEKTLWIEEWAAPGVSEEVMLATFHRLALEHGLSSVCGWFPNGEAIEWQEKPRTQAIPMLHFFDKAMSPDAASFWSIEHF